MQRLLQEGFSCDNGVVFDGTGIAQSHTSTGHVLHANDPSLDNATFQAVQLTVDGDVVKQIPGFVGRPLVDCRVTAVDGEPIGDTIVASGFFTPRQS